MRRSLWYNTWVVFLAALGSLLALLFLPGITTLQRTDQVYREIRDIQQSREEIDLSIVEIQQHMYLVSIRTREFLLDTSPEAAATYRPAVQQARRRIEGQIRAVRSHALGQDGANAVGDLEAQISRYWEAIEPIFAWRPSERQARATYFLREQQRPRRESVVAIAAELRRLTEATYARQYAAIEESQRSFRTDVERIIGVAFLLGMTIAGASIFRISKLESQAIADRRATERAEERMRHLSTQLMRAQEEERRNLSRELHDEVGQALTALRMELGLVERLQNSPDFPAHVSEAKSLAERTLRSVRNLAVGLRPSVLDLGLAPALQSQAREIARRSPIHVQVRTEGDLERMPDEHRTCLYRLVQESLTNAMRHSSARTVDVIVSENDGVIALEVRDDGVGFDTSQDSDGIGLMGMQERVRELGGTLVIESFPGQGTRLCASLRVPVSPV